MCPSPLPPSFTDTVDQGRHHQRPPTSEFQVVCRLRASLPRVLDSNQLVVFLVELLGKICNRARDYDTKVQ